MGLARNPRTRTPRALARGFTLIELMTVVIIVGVLATLGIVAYRRFITSAKASEAIYMVGSIRSAQESYRAETLGYLDVSTNITSYYPMATPSSTKWAWDNPSGNNYAQWRQLGARSDGPVYFGYAVKAGAAGAVPPTLSVRNPPAWPTTTEPWYIIQAAGDVNDNAVPCYVVGSSFTGEIGVQDEGE